MRYFNNKGPVIGPLLGEKQKIVPTICFGKKSFNLTLSPNNYSTDLSMMHRAIRVQKFYLDKLFSLALKH